MDAVKFLKERARMCEANQTGEMTCENCAAYKGVSQCYKLGEPKDPEKMVAIVEQWAAARPIKTRQSVFLEMFPNAPKYPDTKIVVISPCEVDEVLRGNCPGVGCCPECRKKFWLAEVEDA
jgi:hypothetical protein